jgi:L-lysine 6-transaminase
MPETPQNNLLTGAQSSAAMLEELARYVVADPYPFVLDLARCHDSFLVTVEGREIFDWAQYFGSKLIAHNHPGLYEPDYLRELSLAANNKTANPDFLTPQCLAYYRTLHELAPRCMNDPRLEVYVVNSGAEAVENMMKYFINLHYNQLKLHNSAAASANAIGRFIYFDQAFHGRTIFALNVTQSTSDPVITRNFQGYIPGNLKIPFPFVDRDRGRAANEAITDESLQIVDRLLTEHAGEIAGIIVEPIQGAGGHRIALPRFFAGLSELAHRHQTNLGFDEVQTAGGQTGSFWAADQLDLPYPPQAIAAAKKLANGVVYMLYPMEDRGVLDSTWGGTLADMVRFVQEIKIIRRENLIEQVPAKSTQLVAGLDQLAKDFPGVLHNPRGMGLYQGFGIRDAVGKTALLEFALQQHNLLLLGAGASSIRIRPTLSVTEGEIDLLIDKLRAVCQHFAG